MKTKVLSFAAVFLAVGSCHAGSPESDYSAVSCLKITEINQSWWGLSEVDVPTNEWQDVETLYLGSNELQSVPAKLGELSQLRRLYLENNRIQSLDDSAKEFGSLSSLFLHGNKLVSLPDAMGSLANLTELSLSYNKLQSLPASMRNLKNSLKMLNLVGNPLQERGEGGTLGWRDLKEIFGESVLFNPR